MAFCKFLLALSVEGQPTVSGSSISTSVAPDPSYLLHNIAGDSRAEEQMVGWSEARICWQLPDFDATSFDNSVVSRTLSLFLEEAAYPGDHETLGVPDALLDVTCPPVVDASTSDSWLRREMVAFGS